MKPKKGIWSAFSSSEPEIDVSDHLPQYEEESFVEDILSEPLEMGNLGKDAFSLLKRFMQERQRSSLRERQRSTELHFRLPFEVDFECPDFKIYSDPKELSDFEKQVL